MVCAYRLLEPSTVKDFMCAGVVSIRLSFRVFAVCHFLYYSIKGDNFCPSPAALKQMEVIEIPTTVLFEKMLKKLGLTSPTYKPRMSEEAKLGASITFYPTTECLRFSYGTISLLGHPMDSVDAANNDATKAAIKYMGSKYPYDMDIDSSETDQFSGYYPSPSPLPM